MASKDGMLISVILDRSGSMGGLVNSVIEHFNAYKEEVSHLPNVIMSVHQFDTEYETIANALPVSEVPDLTNAVYYARGGTALLDAIGRTIRAIDAIPNKPSKVVVVINTDGYENSSHEYRIDQIKEMVTERQNNHDWQFVFVGAGIDAFSAGTSFGVHGSSTWTSSNSTRGYGDTYTVLAAATASYASGDYATMDMAKSGIDLGIDQGTEEPKDDIDSKVNGQAGTVRDRAKRKRDKLGSSSR